MAEQQNQQSLLAGVTDAIHTIFLAGVGAVATTGEKGSELFDQLVKKGEATVEQGKQTNNELLKKAQSKVSDKAEGALRSYLQTLSPEERDKFVASVQKAAQDAADKANDAAEKVAAEAAEVAVEEDEAKGEEA